MGSALLAAIGQSKELGRDEAGRIYRRLLEKGASDPKSVEQMKAAMEVLGLTLTDASRHLQLRNQARQLQERIRAGAALDDARHKAGKGIEESVQDRSRLLTEWQKQHNQRIADQSDLDQRYMSAGAAVRELHSLKLQHAVALADLACCSEGDLDRTDPLTEPQ